MARTSIDLEISGLDELSLKIKKLARDDNKTKEINKILWQLAKPTLDRSKQLAPVGSRYTTWNGKKVTRPDYVPGTGRDSIARKKMTKARNPMVTISPRSRSSADGWYMRRMVIPGHNIYRPGFKRSRKGRRDADLAKTRASNLKGAKSRVPPNPFLDKAYKQTKGTVTAKAERRMAKYFQKQIDRLS
jgi:hypothetical protein